MEKSRVFLLEDEGENRGKVEHFLGMCGFEVFCFDDEIDIEKRIQDSSPHLILLDLFLSKSPGLALLKKIRELPQTRDLPILMMSSDNSEETCILTLSSGADEFLPRPIRMAELSLRVQNALDLARYREELVNLNAKLEKERNRLRKYFSEDLVEKILSEEISTELGGINVRASILFLDIRNSTHLSETLGAQRFASLISMLFSDLMEEIFKNEGSVNKLLGDGILATFGCPQPTENDTFNAVRTALDMAAYIDSFNQVRPHYLKEPIGIGIGIATGKVFAGNIGSVRRIEYAVMGDPVNIASRLEALTKSLGGNIIIDSSTRNALMDRISASEPVIQRIAGIEDEVKVYIVDDLYAESLEPEMVGV